MDIRVGDLVTYKNLDGDIIQTLIYDSGDLKRMEKALKSTELIKIERPKYEVVEEKKELLTEEEREFLKIFIKIKRDEISKIERKEKSLDIMSKGWSNTILTDKFQGLELYKKYTLKELGLEEN